MTSPVVSSRKECDSMYSNITSRTALDRFSKPLPHPIELRDDLVGDAETRSYSRHETASLREPV